MDEAIEAYKEFLQGKRSVEWGNDNITISDIFRFNTQNDRDWNRYALFDMNGDGIPELHICSVGPYDILTYRDGELVHWAGFWSYCKPLNNGVVLNEHIGGANTCISYAYIILDFYGKEVLRISFEKYNSNSDGIYDENYDYFFEDIKVSKEDWDILTEKYLSIGFDEIKWHVYKDGDLAF